MKTAGKELVLELEKYGYDWIKQEVESEGEIYECVSSYSLFGVVYHLEGTYSLTAELNPVPKEIFMSFYK